MTLPRFALRHKRDHFFLPDPKQPGSSLLSFETYEEADAYKSKQHNAHQLRVVKSDPRTGQFV